MHQKNKSLFVLVILRWEQFLKLDFLFIVYQLQGREVRGSDGGCPNDGEANGVHTTSRSGPYKATTGMPTANGRLRKTHGNNI